MINMSKPTRTLVSVLAFFLAVSGGRAESGKSEPLKMIPFEEVRMEDGLWQPLTAKLVEKTLPHAFKQTEVAQTRLRLCAEWLESGGKTPKPEPHRFDASDLFKVMEGAAMMIQAKPDAAIEKEMDRIIDIIARAQKEDGYLYVPHIVGNPIIPEMGERPYSYVLHSHELYNLGHLYEAAVAYARATGKEKLLKVSEKSARHVEKAFFEGDPNYNDGKPVMQAPGHQGIEIALAKLFNYTGEEFYLNMAKKFLDIRGVTYKPGGEHGVSGFEYAQQHAPVAEQRKAVGHAVRATYMYAAMAEVDSLTWRRDYAEALDAIWHNIVDAKMHISGGLGAVPHIEGFGPDYVLPNKDTYLETCAAIGNLFFNMRMFLNSGDAKYVDVAEVALLNNGLSGIGKDGTSFFYPNPLEADAGHMPRAGWFGTACCPSNVARVIPQVPGYMYAQSGEELYTLLYGACSASLRINGTKVDLRQETEYPFEGSIRFQVEPSRPVEFAFHLRIPTWAGDQFVPGKLYHYTETSSEWSVRVNGEAIALAPLKGYLKLEREWRSGDVIELELPMPVKANTCIELVEANRGRVALTRGPLLLSGEGIDNGGHVQRMFVDADAAVSGASVERIAEGILRGLPQVSVPAKELTGDGVDDAVLKLIPYYSWSNRGRHSMNTWFATRRDLAQLPPVPQAEFSDVRASHTYDQDSVSAIILTHTPKSSQDGSLRRWTSFPQVGKTQWVEMLLAEEMVIKSVGVFWYDDNGGVKLPKAWHIEVPNGEGWETMKIYNTDSYSTLPDLYNTVQPDGIYRVDRFRIMIEPQPNASVGIISVGIDVEK
jgi:uncharacterized protein